MARSGPSRKLGLDDPNVIERDDRGERDYNLNLQHELAPSIGPIPNHANLQDTNGNGLIPLIRSELEINMIPRSPDSYSHFFIPRDKLRSIITADRVLQIIQQLYCRNLSPFQISELQTRICFGSTQCWKLFAVLLLSDKLDNLLDLVDKEGVSDNCLPIRLKTRCCLKKHKHPTIESWPIQVRGSASMWSYAVKAPYFTRPSGGHYHYILDGNDVIPIIGTVTNESASNAPVKHQKSGNDNGTVDGGFGQVTRVILDESHYHFEDLATGYQSGQRRQFALKRLLSASRETFSQELASLRSFQDQNDKRLIKLLATWEVREIQFNRETTTYYLLFPWANGDLWTFWKEHALESQRLPRCSWMADEIFQLGRAIMHFHKERHNQLKQMKDAVDKSRHELYGRHGDIKAENILWFEEKDDGEPGAQNKVNLMISDFGLGRLNSKYSRSGVDPKSLEKTATYKAPEFDLHRGKISRVSDIFSFGCLCLEFVTWYLEGWVAVNDEFPDYRMENDTNGYETDTFFTIEADERETERAIIKPKVRSWISRLRENQHASPYILQFLELIEDKMLEPDSSKRITSKELVPELKLLADGCRVDSSFWKENSNGLPPKY